MGPMASLQTLQVTHTDGCNELLVGSRVEVWPVIDYNRPYQGIDQNP